MVDGSLIEDTVYGVTVNDSTISALIGTRLTPDTITAGTATFPCMVYQKISAPEHHDIDVAFPRFQFSSYAETKTEVLTLALAVKELWQRYKGVYNGVKIKQGVYLDETKAASGKDGLWRVDTDIKIIYEK